MAIDWREWVSIPDVTETPDMVAVLSSDMTTYEAYRAVLERYHRRIEKRIRWILRQLPGMGPLDRAEAFYVLAALFRRINDELKPETVCGVRPVRYYAIQCVRLNPQEDRAWALLAWCYRLIAGDGLGCSKWPVFYGPRIVAFHVERPGEVEKTDVNVAETSDNHVEENDVIVNRPWGPQQTRWTQWAVTFALKALELKPRNQEYRRLLQGCLETRRICYRRFGPA